MKPNLSTFLFIQFVFIIIIIIIIITIIIIMQIINYPFPLVVTFNKRT